jgi:hypothetical protein
MRTKSCIQALSSANSLFAQKQYADAKREFQGILDSNPKDAYATAKVKECTDLLQPKPTPAPTQMPTTPTTSKPATITLSVSNSNLSFPSSGGKQNITVTTNVSSYDVTLLTASWCSVTKYSTYFVVNCDPNYGTTARKEWFKIKAGDKEIKIDVNQSGVATSTSSNSDYGQSSNYNTYKSNKCFNCPNAKYPWGLSVGYVNKTLQYEDYGSFYGGYDNLEGVSAGVRFESLFKYGFGLNMGLFYEYYSTAFTESYDYDYEEHVLNIPLHLEYRFNFSRYFNLFVYGGLGFDVVTNSSFNDYSFYQSLDYGGGLRIDHVQFNIGQSVRIKDVWHAYISAGSSYTFEMPDGTYQPFFYYGKGWNPEKVMKETSEGKLKGGFIESESFGKDDPQTLNNEILTYELILQSNRNFSTRPSNAADAL